jgi:hypothetical protein
MDFMIVYNALVLNDGKPQAFFDHPSYFTILSVKTWFQLMHSLGLLDAWKLSAIPSALNVPGFDAAMTSAVRAGRIVAWLTATLFVVVFAALARRLFETGGSRCSRPSPSHSPAASRFTCVSCAAN